MDVMYISFAEVFISKMMVGSFRISCEMVKHSYCATQYFCQGMLLWTGFHNVFIYEKIQCFAEDAGTKKFEYPYQYFNLFVYVDGQFFSVFLTIMDGLLQGVRDW